MKNSRHKMWYRFILLLTMIALVFTVSACGSESVNAPKDYPNRGGDNSVSEGVGLPSTATFINDGEYGFVNLKPEAPSNQSDYTDSQKIIYNGTINIDVNDMEQATTEIERAVKDAGGFMLNSTKTENDRRFYVNYEFKVPVAGLNSLMEEIESLELGKITYNNIDGRDVTEEYQDISSRLKAKRVYEARLLELFAKADKTEDLLRIANDLSRVQEEIESLEGRQKYLAYHADNSSLTVELTQYKDRVAPTASSWTKAIDGLKLTMQNIGKGLVNFFIWLVSYLPIIILVTLIAVGVWFLVRIKRRRKRERFEQVEQELLNENERDGK